MNERDWVGGVACRLCFAVAYVVDDQSKKGSGKGGRKQATMGQYLLMLRFSMVSRELLKDWEALRNKSTMIEIPYGADQVLRRQ